MDFSKEEAASSEYKTEYTQRTSEGHLGKTEDACAIQATTGSTDRDSDVALTAVIKAAGLPRARHNGKRSK